MQALFCDATYDQGMAKNTASPATAARLKALREAAGLTVRELARQIGEQHTNVLFWEKSGILPRSNVLIPMAKALGVTVEELLGEPGHKRATSPAGRVRRVFEEVSKLPRRQQEKVAEFVEAFVERRSNIKHSSKK